MKIFHVNAKNIGQNSLQQEGKILVVGKYAAVGRHPQGQRPLFVPCLATSSYQQTKNIVDGNVGQENTGVFCLSPIEKSQAEEEKGEIFPGQKKIGAQKNGCKIGEKNNRWEKHLA